MRVAVIGASVAGASVAYHLARRGARVESVRTATVRGARPLSFCRSNVYRRLPRRYFELSHAAVIEHGALAAQLGQAWWWQQCGALVWDDDVDDFVAHVEQLREWGANVTLHSAMEANRRWEPRVEFPSPNAPVARFPAEAWVDAPSLIERLMQAAAAKGAVDRGRVGVRAIDADRTQVVLGDGTRIAVDAIVNAAGPEADSVAAMVGAPLRLRLCSGMLAELEVETMPISRILQGPIVSVRPAGPMRVQARAHAIDDALFGEPDTTRLEALADGLCSRARQVVPALRSATLAAAWTGTRATLRDGFPSIGATPGAPGCFEAVLHRDAGLGPLVGRLLAEQITTGQVDPLIRPFDPARDSADRLPCS